MDPHIVYAGTDYGVFRSADAGQTWTYSGQSTLGIVSALVIDPVDTRVIYAATWSGVFRSADSGATWTS